jgi:integrase
LSKLSPVAFKEYRERRLKDVAGATVRRELGLLQSVFEMARREWDIGLAINPVANVRKPKSAGGRERRLNPGEIEALLAAAGEARNAWLTPAILLAIETGMRRGELLNIRRHDIDFDLAVLVIPQTKTDTPRTIPLTYRAAEMLKLLAAETQSASDHVIPASANAFRLAWERCRRRAAMQQGSLVTFRFHDLRHEAVSRFFELGLSVPEVALISGHRDPRMLFRYTHLKPLDVGAKLNRAAQRLLS